MGGWSLFGDNLCLFSPLTPQKLDINRKIIQTHSQNNSLKVQTFPKGNGDSWKKGVVLLWDRAACYDALPVIWTRQVLLSYAPGVTLHHPDRQGGETHHIGYGCHSFPHRQALQYPKAFPSSGAKCYSGAKCLPILQHAFPQTAWPGFWK